MNLRILLAAACLACLQSACFAQEVQARAEALLQQARQLSDIRSQNAPAFRLKATFSFVGKDLDEVQGTYTEIWVSDSQWRRETTINDQRRVEVGGPSRRWLLDSSDSFPDRAARVRGILQILPPSTTKFEFKSLTSHTDQEPAADCAVTKSSPTRETYAFCFDKKSGLLLQMVFPETRLSQVRDVRTVQHSCSYGTFKKLANDWFPHEMICFEDGHRDLGIKLTELSLEPSPDPALFTPPPGAIELANCRTVLTPPRAISTPQPLLASGSADQNRVAVEAVLDVKGKPQNVRVVASASETLDKNAVNAVREWRFKPATCDGEPVPYQMRVEVIFRFFR